MGFRINGFKQIEAFYSIVFSGKYDFSPQHISLYMFLLNQNNRANWVEWFKCPYDLAMNGAMIGSKKTYYKCLTELKEWGLIDYIAGENQFKAPKISLLRLENAPQLAPQCEPASEPLPIPPCEPLPTTARVRYINYITNNFNNLITNNYKQLQETDFDFDNFFVISLKNDKVKKEEGAENFEILNIEFEQFWNLYDKKVGDKAKLVKKWVKLTQDEKEKIFEYVPKYKIAQPEKKYRLNVETFFNNKSWNDEIITTQKNKNGQSKFTYEELLNAAADAGAIYPKS